MAIYNPDDDDLFQIEGTGNTPREAVKDAIREGIEKYPNIINSIKEKPNE